MVIELRVSSSVSVTGPHFQLALPSIGSLRLRFPDLLGTTARSDSSIPFPRRFVSFGQRYHAASTCHAGSKDASGLRRVWVPICGRSLTWSYRGLPGSWGVRCVHALLYDPGEAGTIRSFRWPGVAFRERDIVGPHDRLFRGSITRPTHSLFTLRSKGHPNATQNSLPVGDQPSPGGVEFPRDSIEGLRFRSFVHLLQACLAHLSCSFSGSFWAFSRPLPLAGEGRGRERKWLVGAPDADSPPDRACLPAHAARAPDPSYDPNFTPASREGDRGPERPLRAPHCPSGSIPASTGFH